MLGRIRAGLSEGWRLAAHSLSGRLLLLTLFYVMTGEVLIFVPTMGQYYRELLGNHIESAELAVMGPNGAVEIVYRRELVEAADPTRRRAELIDEYTEAYANPYIAAERGYIDDVISPADTRRVICRSLDILASKREELPRRKHGNVPL